MRRWAIAIALTALVAGIGSTFRAEADIVLNPGYIQGKITIPGFDVERYTITSIAKDPTTGQSFYAKTFADEDGSYLLTVEGGLEHDVAYSATLAVGGAIKNGSLVWKRQFAPDVGETITHDVILDGAVTGTLTVPDFDFRTYQIWVTAPQATADSPAYGVTMRLTYDITATTSWRIPVLGGVDDYAVELESLSYSTVLPTGRVSGNLWDLAVHEVDVSAGGTATLALAPPIGRLAGTITATEGRIYRWTLISKTPYGEDLQAEARSSEYYVTGYVQPVLAGTVTTGLLVYPENYPGEWLDNQTVTVPAGDTVQVDWSWSPPPTGNVAGVVQASGIEANVVGIATNYRGTNPNEEGSYEILNVLPSTQEQLRLMNLGREERSPLYVWATGFHWSKPITVVANQTTTVDLVFEGAMLEGTLLADEAYGEGEVQHHHVHFQPVVGYGDTLATAYADASFSDLSVADGWGGNAYRIWLPEGDWRPYSVRVKCDIPLAEGTCVSDMRVNRSQIGQPWPTTTIVRNSEPTFDFDLQPARVTVRLRVADGSPLSDPNVGGVAVWEDGETVLYAASASGRVQGAPETTVGEVVFYAVPATYDLRGEGRVKGTMTTFGSTRLTVGPGDVVEQDLDGPVIVITSPEAYAELQSSTVTVTGTVTDDSPITSLTINGQTVTDYDPDTGAFTFELTGLVAGDNAFTVAAQDVHGNASSVTRTVTVVNTGPVAVIDCQTTVEATSATATSVTLDGTDSYDENGDALTYAWYVDGTLVGTDAVVTPTLGVGDHVVVLVVTDAWGETGEASTMVHVVDTTPPTATVSGVSPGALWPPDHKLTPVDIELAVHDAVDSAVACRIVEVRCSEPEDGEGDGETEPDWIYSGLDGDLSLWLRAERSGLGDGRIYTVVVECKDNKGNYTLVEIEIPVEHDKGR